MKNVKVLSLIIALSLMIFSETKAQVLIPNSSFENWSEGKPTYWDATNLTIGEIQIVTVTQDTVSPQNGNSYVSLETVSNYIPFNGDVIVPGIITLGTVVYDLQNLTGNIEGGIPFVGRPVKLKGYFKSLPAQGDSCFLAMLITKWNYTYRDTIGTGHLFISNSVSNWTYFDFILQYSSEDIPDSMNIILSSSDVSNQSYVENSHLWVDNLSLDYGPASIIDYNFNKNISVFVEPGSDQLVVNFNFNSDKKVLLSLSNINGQIIYKSQKTIKQAKESVNINSLAKGIYIVNVITDSNQRFSQKIEIK